MHRGTAHQGLPVLNSAIASKGSTPGIIFRFLWEWVRGLLSQVKRSERVDATTSNPRRPWQWPLR